MKYIFEPHNLCGSKSCIPNFCFLVFWELSGKRVKFPSDFLSVKIDISFTMCYNLVTLIILE